MRDSLRSLVSAYSLASSLALAVTPACARSPEKVVVSTLRVEVPRRFEGGGLRERMEQHARRAADGSARVQFGEGPTHRLLVEVGEHHEEANRTYQLVAVALRSMGDAPDFEALGVAPALAPDPMLEAFNDGWNVVQAQRRLHVAATKELLAKLADSDKRVRVFVITELGERRAREAVPPLSALLTDERPVDEALRIVGALVSIGDERAVSALIDLTRRKPPGFVRQIVFAVASLGGPLAEAFLVTLADGHPDLGIQHDAREALAEMKRP